jgi:tRNA modification GTPase
MNNDTICAISTAVGTGAISIVRCSGINAISIVNKIFKGKDLTKVASHTINYGYIYDGKEKIDEVLISVMKSPKTFTMEDVVEINTHGGMTTTNKILELLLINGCRLAEPGEFTKRAFLNGRIDLIEAEAVEDIITAESDKARKLAINNISGELSSKINKVRKQIITLQADIEVNIDYPEYEEATEYTFSTIKPKLLEIKQALTELLNNASNGKLIKNGINIALIGKPNVGKSSILNSFLQEEKAIVTSIPGTTRDIVEGKINLEGITMNFLDTAGIRNTKDLVEKIGVSKSIELSKTADLIIYVIDNSLKITKGDMDFIYKLNPNKTIIFINKNDLKSSNKYQELNNFNIVYGNTLESNGLSALKEQIIKMFAINKLETSDYTFLSNARQIALVKQALSSIENAFDSINNQLPIDLYTIDLRNAYNLLGEIIGETYKDDLLDELFSKFCLGK